MSIPCPDQPGGDPWPLHVRWMLTGSPAVRAGKYNFQTHENEKSMPDLLSIDFPFFMLFDLPARIGRSAVLVGKWVGFMIFGNASLYNENHALVNYIQVSQLVVSSFLKPQ